MNLKFTALAAAALLMTACPAWAAPLIFNYSGAQGSLSFTLADPSNPDVATPGVGVEYVVSGLENGVASDFGGGVIFASADFFGGFQTLDGNFTTSGAQLYSGSESAPTFNLGPVTLVGPDGVTTDGALTIAPAAAAPEPSTWALLIAGVGLAGAALRRRRRLALAA